MSEDTRKNSLLSVAIFVGSVLIITFFVALTYSKGGEIAGALGSLIGGIIGAGGAVATVYLLISQQRQEEERRVTEAIRREIIEFSKFITAALDCCGYIKYVKMGVPKKNAHSIMIPIDPIIYKSIADRISLLPYPQQVVAFYIRVVEVQALIQMIIESPGDENASIPSSWADTIAESLITACQLAVAIIGHVSSKNLDEHISKIAIENLKNCLKMLR